MNLQPLVSQRAQLARCVFLTCSFIFMSMWIDTLLATDNRIGFWRAFQADDIDLMVAFVSNDPKAFSAWASDLLSTAMVCAAGPVAHVKLAWSEKQKLSALDLTTLALRIHELLEDAGQPVMDDGAEMAHRIMAALLEGAQDGGAEIRVLKLDQAHALKSLLLSNRSPARAKASAKHIRDREFSHIQEHGESYLDAGDDARAEGNTKHAQERYLQAIEIYSEVADVDAEWPTACQQIALAHQKLSRVAIHENDVMNMGYHLEEAERHTRLALKREPENPSHWRSLATIQGGLAAYAAMTGHRQARQEHLQARLESSTQAARLAPNDHRTAASTAASHAQLAELSLSEEQFPEAKEHARLAVETFDHLVREVPGQAGIHRGRYMAYLHLGLAEVKSGNHETGRMHLARASFLAHEQLNARDDVETRVLLALIEFERAEINVASGDPRLAIPNLERACEVSQRIIDPRLSELRSLCDMR